MIAIFNCVSCLALGECSFHPLRSLGLRFGRVVRFCSLKVCPKGCFNRPYGSGDNVYNVWSGLKFYLFLVEKPLCFCMYYSC